MSFARYPAYKDSGVEWLGEVPEHWRVDRLKASISSARNGIWGNEDQGNDDDIPCVRVADFDRVALQVRLNEPTVRNVTAKEREGRVLQRGDLLLEKSGGGEKQPVGCVVLYDFDQPAVCSNFVARVHLAAEMDSSYWRYVHAAAYAVRLTLGSINQTSGIQNLDQDRYFNERAPFPPLKEQTAIATFLDRETAKIDALVAEQERLIALLKEKRQAIISHAVTKGLDPTVPMQYSGVEWLGDVPAHWHIKPLKHILRLITEKTDRRTNPVGLENVASWSGSFISTDVEFSGDGIAFEAGDILFGKLRPYLAKALLATKDGEAIGDFHVLRPATNVLPRFAQFQVLERSFIEIVNGSTFGSKMPRASWDLVGAMLMPIPPMTEQAAIAAFLDRETAKIDAVVVEQQRLIALLHERRAAFVSAAVTGQIDVRGLADARYAPDSIAAAARPARAAARFGP